MYNIPTLLLDTCPDALCCLAKTGEIIAASKAFQALFETAPNTYEQTRLHAWMDPPDADRFQEALNGSASLEHDLVFTFHPRCNSPENQRTFEVILRLLPTPLDQSLPSDAYFACTIRDITKRAIDHSALLNRLTHVEFDSIHLRTLIDMIPGVVWHGPVDPNDPSVYRSTHMSDYLERVTGYSAKQWLETPNFWRNILHPEDRDRVLQRTSQALQEGKPMPPYRVFAKDGGIVWFQSFIRTLRNSEGKPQHMFGLTLDVTEFKETELAMAEVLEHAQTLQNRLNDVIGGIPGIVWESWFQEDPDRDRINFCSDQIHRITPHSIADWSWEPRAWLKLVLPGGRTLAQRELERIESQGQGYLEFQVDGKDGMPIWLENHVLCIRDEEGKLEGLRGIALDISERKLADLERNRLEREVREQDERINELSAPLIPLGHQIIVMPLVGALDEKRSRKILQALLKGVSSMRARLAMLDVTGLYCVTQENANDLIRAIHAVGMLGAEVVLTGVRPDLAQALVEMDVDLSRIRVYRTLAKALVELFRS